MADKGNNKNKKERHILALSGGKDSAALAVYLRDKYPDLKLEYVFTDSGCELPETYEFLKRIRAVLNIEIKIIKSERNFDWWLKYYKGVLPSPQQRWCTRDLKLKPFESYIGNDTTYSYVAIRADEKNREGYVAKQGRSIIPIHPFVEDGITLKDVLDILEKSKLGTPDYYGWRKRSGCYFCFYQSDSEWKALKKYHPDLFHKARQYEENHSDGRTYTWRGKKGGKPLFLRELDDFTISEEKPCFEESNHKTLLQVCKDINIEFLDSNSFLK
ncbi:phosphoadenosine phosphosulfate reductase domain-containing protein [Desulfolucanica intricata]|uniref:phosphoadenosine phosphosulfate reductase domain-containing protein n=1 Tax=Desulfolucanica intricata TaxID=1285191 RepID=UPI000AECB7FB|nr:phosphoadenosine phosphosulfate reductase family protein [Desulfolucanica intricata]